MEGTISLRRIPEEHRGLSRRNTSFSGDGLAAAIRTGRGEGSRVVFHTARQARGRIRSDDQRALEPQSEKIPIARPELRAVPWRSVRARNAAVAAGSMRTR